MGNLKPKLSRTVIREREIRAQLGLGRLAGIKAKCRQGAERAKKELDRRNRVSRQRRPGWDDLCFPLQDIILSQLSIPDLVNARMAGLGASSVASRGHMRQVMRARCDKLRPLWDIWKQGTPRSSRGARNNCGPLEFTSSIKRLCLSPEDGLPESIYEMKALRALDVSRTHHSALLGYPPPLTMLPNTLALCHTLFDLQISHHNFEEIPQCVLDLTNLRRFVVDYSLRLKFLPEDIGHRLTKLTSISFFECRKVKAVPESLLVRLEKNTKNFNPKKVPLYLSKRYFDNDYLANTITCEKYPTLAQYRVTNLLTPRRINISMMHEFMMDGFDFP